MPMYKCEECGTEVFVSHKVRYGKKVAVCPNPECGATAPLKIKNGYVCGLKHSFMRCNAQASPA